MFTKWIVPLIVFSLFLPNCAKEQDNYYEVPDIQLKGAACFSNVTSKLDKYFNGIAKQKEIEEVWDCAVRALHSFTDYVDGGDGKNYKAQDLKVFLEKYFLNTEKDRKLGKNKIITDQLLEEIMEIKRLFLGGNRKNLSKDEIGELIQLIGTFRKITVELLPHTRLLFAGTDDIPPAHKFSDAELALKKAFFDVLGMVQKNNVTYDLSRFSVLLKELSDFFKIDDPDSKLADMTRFAPTAIELRGILLNSSRGQIGANEWEDTARVVGQFMSMFFRGRAYFSEKSLIDLDQFEGLYGLITNVLDVFKMALSKRANSVIPNSEVDVLITELGKIELLPFGMQIQTAQKMWRRLIDFIFNPDNTNPVQGITLSKIAYLEREVLHWRKTQLALINEDDLNQDPEFKEMVGVLSTPWPLRLDINGRIIIDGDKKRSVDLESSTRLNWARVLFTALYKVYITDAKRKKSRQMSTAELRVAFLDLQPILAGMGLIDADDFGFDEKLFRDANLFMPRSDGDKYLGYYEVVEFLHYVFAGISAGDFMIEGLAPKCKVDDKRTDVTCFRSVFQKEFKVLMEHIPLYLKYANGLSDSKWKKDIKALEKINREEGAKNTPISNADIYETFIALQYIETLFMRFDKNQSGDLDIAEVLKTLKHFRNVLGDIFKFQSEAEFEENQDEMEAYWTYMFKYEAFPNPDDEVSVAQYSEWKAQKSKWKLAANRGTVLQILALVSSLQK